jgi:hypothetical protein
MAWADLLRRGVGNLICERWYDIVPALGEVRRRVETRWNVILRV